jgi:hypothetical protein
VDKDSIIIGEPIHLTLEADLPAGTAPSTNITWPVLDTLPHFEWRGKGTLDSVIQPGGRTYRQQFTITSFDSGAWAIPQLQLLVGNRRVLTDSIRIGIGYSKFDANKDYHDIREIVDVPNPFAKWIPWIVATLTLVAVSLVVWLMAKKKVLRQIARVIAPGPRLSPYEEAMKQLDELEKQQLAEAGQVKPYYTRLNDILRHFVARRLGISSLSETNEELIGQLRRLPLGETQFSEMAEALRMSDFVKFAKYLPGSSENERNLGIIRSSVAALQRVAEEREAASKPQETVKTS